MTVIRPKLILSPLQTVAPVDFEAVQSEIRKYLNVEVLPCEIDGIYGYATKEIMYLAQECPLGCWYHELFHLAMPILIKSAKVKIFDEGLAWLGYSQERESLFSAFYLSQSYNISTERLRMLVVEELLADAFEDFMNILYDTPYYLKNYPNIVHNMLDTSDDSTIWQFFCRIQCGDFAHLPKKGIFSP